MCDGACLTPAAMRALAVIFLLSSCMSRGGPTLPPNVGADHTSRRRAPSAEPEAPAEPVEAGTTVWANFHDTGFYFHGVVVDRREAMHRVLYADGASEWLPASALLPDSLGEDALVHVRNGFGEDFHSAQVTRRAGHALYVRMANGDERWASLPHVRFRAGEPGTPGRGDEPRSPPTAAPGQVGSDVLVNYQLQGFRFPGIVTARAEDGRAHVVYLDGESEWAHSATVAPDDAGPGTVVHVRRSWEPPVWVQGRIQRRMGSAVAIELDDGGMAWTSMLRVRVPVPDPPPAARTEPEPAPPAPTRRRPR